jgi:hypothetical protein
MQHHRSLDRKVELAVVIEVTDRGRRSKGIDRLRQRDRGLIDAIAAGKIK